MAGDIRLWVNEYAWPILLTILVFLLGCMILLFGFYFLEITRAPMPDFVNITNLEGRFV